MMFTEAEFIAVTKQFGPEEGYRKLVELHTLNNAINTARKALQQLQADYERQKKEIKLGLQRLQDNCPHYVTTYQSDPSGGSDSSNSCDRCGKEV